ncbi:MAG TPA: molybdopterin-dependent oxidoreductase [Euzebya sp.]|nr:molybdopterin-dependent oxidoreductase [Euzebya sp.]
MGRRTNLALAVLLVAAVATGLWANTIGTDWPLDPATVHGAIALAILLLAPWKSLIIRRGLRRTRGPRGRRTWSLILLGLVLIVLGSGLVHSTGVTDRVGPLTIFQVHIGGAVLALLLVVVHYRAHPVRVRRTDVSRRALLQGVGLTAAAGVTWAAWEGVLAVTGARGADRRFTGSHERGSGSPSAMPVTSWLDDRVQHIDAADWTIRVAARDLDLDALAAFPREELDAVLDCTSGWYSQQRWTGVRLDRLLDVGDARSIEVRSATGYGRRFPVADLDRLWLVTHAGGEPLSAGHGFPARIVAPDRRGFWWVKWVVEVQPSSTPAWLQLPFPVT